MPTYYVEDYDGPRENDPSSKVEAKVVEAEEPKPAAKKTSRAQTKG